MWFLFFQDKDILETPMDGMESADAAGTHQFNFENDFFLNASLSRNCTLQIINLELTLGRWTRTLASWLTTSLRLAMKPSHICQCSRLMFCFKNLFDVAVLLSSYNMMSFCDTIQVCYCNFVWAGHSVSTCSCIWFLSRGNQKESAEGAFWIVSSPYNIILYIYICVT